MLAIKTAAGPNPYAAGGFTVTFGEFEKVAAAIAKCDNDDALAEADTAHALRVSIAGNIVTIQVWKLATAGSAWTQESTGDYSDRTFTVIADGY